MQPYNSYHKGFTEEQFLSALDGDLTPLRSVPKVDLHAHSTLSTPYEKVKEIAPNVTAPPSFFSDFSDFMEYISNNYFPIYTEPLKVWKLHEACLDHMVTDGIVYSEMSYDLCTPERMGISWEEHSCRIAEHINAVSDKITICCELGIKRELPANKWQPLLSQALATGLFSSIDLYGDYEQGTVEEFKELFAICREQNLKIKIHSGEFLSSDRIEEDLQALEVDGVQHGITIVEKPHLMRRYAERNTPFNVCPTSSVRLSHVSSYKAHPIREMFDAGLRVTIGTDDLSIFNSSLSEEYLHLYRTGLFSVEELEQIRQNGLAVYEETYPQLRTLETR